MGACSLTAGARSPEMHTAPATLGVCDIRHQRVDDGSCGIPGTDPAYDRAPWTSAIGPNARTRFPFSSRLEVRQRRSGRTPSGEDVERVARAISGRRERRRARVSERLTARRLATSSACPCPNRLRFVASDRTASASSITIDRPRGLPIPRSRSSPIVRHVNATKATVTSSVPSVTPDA